MGMRVKAASRIGWVAAVLALAIVVLTVYALTRPKNVYHYRPDPHARPLDTVPEIGFTQKWGYAGEQGWSDFFSGNRYVYPTQEGGLAYLDDTQICFINGDGEDASEPRTLLKPSAFCGSFFPDPSGDYFLAREMEVFRLAHNGKVRWRTSLKPSKHPQNSGEFWLVLVKKESGGLIAISKRDLWHLNASGEVISSQQLDGSTTWIRFVTCKRDNTLLVAYEANRKKWQRLLGAWNESGETIWETSLQHCEANRVILLPDGAVLMGTHLNSINRFNASGSLDWTIRAASQSFDGGSLAVTSCGTIIAWIGKELCFFDLQGQTKDAAIDLGTDPRSWNMDSYDLFTGADGKYYIQIEPTDDNLHRIGGNTILALDAQGQPVWRIELGEDNFDLVAAGYHGELFGLREGATISADKWSGTKHCDYVCLLPEVPRS